MARSTKRKEPDLGWKRPVVLTLLTILSVWPIAQMVLVYRYDVSPWKLAGWGMYATPRPNLVTLEVYGADGAGAISKAQPTAELRRQANQFLGRWKWLGDLARPEELAAEARRQRPDWQRVRVVAIKPVMNRATMKMELHQKEFDFD